MSASERGIGVALISSTSGRLALGAERLALLDAEAVLLVDDGEARAAPNAVRLLHQRVRADDQQRRAGSASRAATSRRAFARRLPVTSTGAMPSGSSSRVIVPRMLLGEQLGRRHDRRLDSRSPSRAAREQRHDRLAAADVALQQPVHAALAAHVGDDLAQRARLRAGERERQRLA